MKKKYDKYRMVDSRRQRIRVALLLLWILIMPITLFYFSPYLPFLGIFKGLITGSVFVFIGQFLSSLVLGRLFCGWFCPSGALQHFSSMINHQKVQRKKLQWIKFVLWLPWVAAWVSLALKAIGIKKDFFYQMDMGISVARPEAYIIYLAVLTLILLLSLVIGRHAFCHTSCWMAPFMILGKTLGQWMHIPGLSLKFNPKECSSCGSCSQVCPMSIDVSSYIFSGKNMKHHDCILCLRCIDTCSKSVINLGIE